MTPDTVIGDHDRLEAHVDCAGDGAIAMRTVTIKPDRGVPKHWTLRTSKSSILQPESSLEALGPAQRVGEKALGAFDRLRQSKVAAGLTVVAGAMSAVAFAGPAVASSGVEARTAAHAPVLTPGVSKRKDCLPGGASRYMINEASASYADNIRIKPSGRITNISNGAFTAPSFIFHDSNTHFMNIKFHLNDGKAFPAGNLKANINFTYTQNGEVHHVRYKNYGVDEYGCN